MTLNSSAFLLFLPLVVAIVYALRLRWSARVAQAAVLAASFLFYGWHRPTGLVLLSGSIVFNWACGRLIGAPGASQDARKRWLLVALVTNITFLLSFKYINLLLGGLTSVARPLGALPNWEFPVGVSFYTLTQVMYLVDCYERLSPPATLFDHATFVSFFPCVTAGPLLRAKLFFRQLPAIGAPTGRHDRWSRSLVLIAIGLIKKVVLADSFAKIANDGYANVSSLSSIGAWLTSLAYTFQLYFDFSGYSDIAFGAAGMLGIVIVRNFNAPYRAATISEFWQRWHISLSSFITSYLYTPILRAMGGITIHTAALATLIAMTIAGLWHGPAWTFVLFGVLHGIALAVNQYWKRTKLHLPRSIASAVTFLFVNLSFIVFRSPNVFTAVDLARRLIPTHTLWTAAAPEHAVRVGPIVAATTIGGVIFAFVGPTSNEIVERMTLSQRAAVATAFMVFVAFILMNGGNTGFVYLGF